MVRTKPSCAARSGGFTLIEAAVAIIIVGLGVVALLGLFAACTQVNAYGSDLSTAVFLAEEMRAMTDDMAFDALGGLDGSTFNGVDANRGELAGLNQYTQQLNVQMVEPAGLTLYVGADPQLALLSATVVHSGQEVTRLDWLRSR